MFLSRSISIFLFTLVILVAWTVPAQAIKSKQVTTKLDDAWEQCIGEASSCVIKCATQANDANWPQAKFDGCNDDCKSAYDVCQAAKDVVADAMKKSKDRKKKKALKKIASRWEKADDKCSAKYASMRYDEVYAATSGSYVPAAESKLFKCQERAKVKYLNKMKEVFKDRN